MAECGVGAEVRLGLPARIGHQLGARTSGVIEEGAVGYFEEPGAEFVALHISARGEVGLDECVLRYVFGLGAVAAAQGKQEPSQGLLLGCRQLDESFSCHRSRLFTNVTLFLWAFGVYFGAEPTAAYEIVGQEGHAHGQDDNACAEHDAARLETFAVFAILDDGEGDGSEAHDDADYAAHQFAEQAFLDACPGLVEAAYEFFGQGAWVLFDGGEDNLHSLVGFVHLAAVIERHPQDGCSQYQCGGYKTCEVFDSPDSPWGGGQQDRDFVHDFYCF